MFLEARSAPVAASRKFTKPPASPMVTAADATTCRLEAATTPDTPEMTVTKTSISSSGEACDIAL